MARTLFLLAIPFGYYGVLLSFYGVYVIDTDGWGILNACQALLQGKAYYVDANKSLIYLIAFLPAALDAAWVFQVITALAGSLTCVFFFYWIRQLTESTALAFAGWAGMLMSPMLFWQGISCNSMVYVTCFLSGALLFFSRRSWMQTALWLTLAGLARPEPFPLIALCFLYFVVLFRRDEISRTSMIRLGALLAVSPVWWFLFNMGATSSGLFSFKHVVKFGESIAPDFNPLMFPKMFWDILTRFYMKPIMAIICLAGTFYCLKHFRKHAYSLACFFVLFLGYWTLGFFNIVLMERYLLPVSIVLLAFGILLVQALALKLENYLSNRKISMKIVAIIVIVLSLHLQGQSQAHRILKFHGSFNRDTHLATEFFKKITTDKEKPTILLSVRRQSPFKFFMKETYNRYQYVTYRDLYFSRSDLNSKQVTWVLYMPDDLFPWNSAVYNFDLLSEEGMEKQKLKVTEKQGLSKQTELWQINNNT